MTERPVLLGPQLRVNTRDGKPLCPCCQDPMVEVQPNAWRCPFAERMWGYIADQVAKALDDALSAPTTNPRQIAPESEQHDAPGVATRGVDTSTTRSWRVADAALGSVGRSTPKARGTRP